MTTRTARPRASKPPRRKLAPAPHPHLDGGGPVPPSLHLDGERAGLARLHAEHGGPPLARELPRRLQSGAADADARLRDRLARGAGHGHAEPALPPPAGLAAYADRRSPEQREDAGR